MVSPEFQDFHIWVTKEMSERVIAAGRAFGQHNPKFKSTVDKINNWVKAQREWGNSIVRSIVKAGKSGENLIYWGGDQWWGHLAQQPGKVTIGDEPFWYKDLLRL